MSEPIDEGVSERAKATSWHALTIPQAIGQLSTSKRGLAGAEAHARLARYGPNTLPRAQGHSVAWYYVSQFKDPLVYLLLAATVVSLAVGEFLDAGFIFVVLQLNAAIGTVQEWKAAQSARALDKYIRSTARVCRDGVWLETDSSQLVPGDLMRVESGARVGADLRLTESQALLVDESLLTGESDAVQKDADLLFEESTVPADRRNQLYAGTVVLTGRGIGVVFATGASTEVGAVARTLAFESGAPPPLIQRIERLSRTIGIGTLALIGVLAFVQILQGVELAMVFLVAVALAVAAIPEGLPVAFTIALAVATRRMQRRHVIVRTLPAVEGLGSCTLIASDKTGTLTLNELTIKRIELIGAGDTGTTMDFDDSGTTLAATPGNKGETACGQRIKSLMESAVLCNEATVRLLDNGPDYLGDTVDIAFLRLAQRLGYDPDSIRAWNPQIKALPYEPERRYAAILTEDRATPGAPEVHVKGAVETVLPMCREPDAPRILALADSLAAGGYRVLAVARGQFEAPPESLSQSEQLANLELLGLVGLIDPVREEAPDAIEYCRKAGISVRMITGDHPETALSVARQLGIAETIEEVVTGVDLRRLSQDPSLYDELVEGAKVFARVEPMQKLDIVKSFQRSKQIVAITGDGVNDAPALQAADIGVAMGLGGTDVARDASDLVLTDDNFTSIVAGIKEGRIAYDNMRKLVYLLIATGLGELVLFLFAILAELPIPLFPAQLLWLNLVTNGIQHIALAFEPGERDVLERPPRPAGQPMFDRLMLAQVGIAGGYMGFVAFLFYQWCLSQGLPESEARNLLLLLMVLFENAHALNARSETQSVFRIPLSTNWFLVLAVLGAQGVHIGATYLPGLSGVLRVEPVDPSLWLMVAAVAFTLILAMETFKYIRARSTTRWDHRI